MGRSSETLNHYFEQVKRLQAEVKRLNARLPRWVPLGEYSVEEHGFGISISRNNAGEAFVLLIHAPPLPDGECKKEEAR